MKYALFMLLAAVARADALDDLRATLSGLDGKDRVRAEITYDFWQRRADDKAPILQQARVAAVAQEGPGGLDMSWSPSQIASVAAEDLAHRRDPEAVTPIRLALNELNAVRVGNYLAGAADLLSKLDKARLAGERAGSWKGQAARLVTAEFVPPLSLHDRKYVKEVDALAKVWVGSDGVPLAAEIHVRVKGKALLVVSFESEENDVIEYAHLGRRLAVVRDSRDSRSSGAGENVEEKDVATLLLSAP